MPAESSNADLSRTVVINQAMARRHFGDANPLGRYIHYVDEPEQKFEIVGVVKDVRDKSLREPSAPAVYGLFFRDTGGWGMTYALRTTSDPFPRNN